MVRKREGKPQKNLRKREQNEKEYSRMVLLRGWYGSMGHGILHTRESKRSPKARKNHQVRSYFLLKEGQQPFFYFVEKHRRVLKNYEQTVNVLFLN